MSYLRYLYLFTYSGVQLLLCCVFVLFFFVLCNLCFQFLWIINFDCHSVLSNLYLVSGFFVRVRNVRFVLWFHPDIMLHYCWTDWVIICVVLSGILSFSYVLIHSRKTKSFIRRSYFRFYDVVLCSKCLFVLQYYKLQNDWFWCLEFLPNEIIQNIIKLYTNYDVSI